MPIPYATQLEGARWLASRRNALLADEPRVGKTGTAIIAADYNLEETMLVVTTASGRPVWSRAFGDWSAYPRDVQVITAMAPLRKPVVIVGWPALTSADIRHALLQRRWERLILDESHAASNFEAKRTQAVFGQVDPSGALRDVAALSSRAGGTWCLSGTPLPHDPSNIYPTMRALCPERLAADPARGWPDVLKPEDFLNRYCQWHMKKLPRGFRKIRIITGGKNLPELQARLDGFILRRTQQDVGIREPIYDTLPLEVTPKMLAAIDGDADREAVLKAAAEGRTKDLEMHLGPVRRLTGEAKARAVVQAVHDEFDGGLDKIVLAYWHTDVGHILREGLAKYGVVGIDGGTSPHNRATAEQRFLRDPSARVFLAQIEAAAEAIDLSSSANLWFVETVFSPRAMKQMALRITNHTQKRQAFVRVCVLQGSIDEAVNNSLVRLWTAINGVLA